MTKRIGSALMVGASLLAVGAVRARADEARSAIELTWQATDGCPNGSSVEREVTQLLGPDYHAASRPKATATVRRDGEAFVVEVVTEVDGISATRSVSATTCERVAHATAIVLALSLDPARASEEPARDAGEASAPKPSESPIVEEHRETSPSSASDRAFVVGAFAVANVGVLPRAAFGPELQIGWANAGYRLDLGAAWFPPVSATVDTARGGDFELAVASLRGCRTWGLGGRMAAGPCVAFEGGVMTGEGKGIRLPSAGKNSWFAARAGGLLTADAGISPLRLALSLDAEVPMTHDEYAVDGVGVVHRNAAVAGRGSLGLEAAF
ncbi:hypothetical protein AKJ09_05278 [Labilithrix luteola]|uniref:Uncharacterized protein n=1 Tax=Labilithrix luteola TaxID=1391654 RepID=A0A0K1PZN5_9BACT|nr:hypothetical protein [Labilithrix luteola]AKU98614.1 hypothetical protein AKJ09_05278 [Labilithrix luteola]